jgi:PAS domain S-box-containing protein
MFDVDHRLNRFLSSAPDPTLIVDGTEKILFASAQIQAAFGYAPHELKGARIEVLMPERFRRGHTSLFRAYFARPSPRPMGASLDLFAKRKDGTEFPVEISLSPLEDRSTAYVICAIRDVSERHKMEEDLRATAARLVIAKTEAEGANAVKSRFLAAASHDLRQPLQAATLYLSLLTKQSTSPDQQETCAKMRAPLQGMSNILDALLDISMLDSGAVRAKRTDFALTTILERVAADLRPLAQQKNLRFDCSESPVVLNSDPALLERIVENLASNAIRYTMEGSVSVTAEQSGDAVRISVVDTGIGIPADALDQIFEEYFQFDNPARNINKGLGLGLAIVKRLASILDHPLDVRSTLGKGSTFAVEVPLAQKTGLIENPAVSGVSTYTGPRPAVLFIEDDPVVADSLTMVFTAEAVESRSAGDGNQAIAQLEEGFQPNIIISDYRLPNENGLRVIERLRKTLGFDIPAILMSGDTSLGKTEVQNMPNVVAVRKPVDPDVLIALIRERAGRPGGASTPNR